LPRRDRGTRSHRHSTSAAAAAESLFTARAARLRQLANNEIKGIPVGETLRGYLLLMAALVDAQAAVPSPAAESLPCRRPLRSTCRSNITCRRCPSTASALLRGASCSTPCSIIWTAGRRPAADGHGAGELRALDNGQLEGCADAVLAELTDGVHPLHAPFVAAALQLMWTMRQPTRPAPRAATRDQHPVPGVRRPSGRQRDPHRRPVARLPLPALQLLLERVAYGAGQVLVLRRHCQGGLPESGSGRCTPDDAPVATGKANDPSKVARAETCDDCHTYRKIFNQEHDFNVDPLADDLASLALDLLVGEAGYARASGNPLLWFNAE
jgi:FdhE protein